MHTKRFNTFFKRWVQFRVDAIPRLPQYIIHTVQFKGESQTITLSTVLSLFCPLPFFRSREKRKGTITLS